MVQSILELVQLIEDLQSAGALELAASTCVTLLHILNAGNFGQDSSENALVAILAPRIGQIAYLVALQLLQVRAASESTHILQLLGCTHRLSDGVLRSDSHDATASAVASPLQSGHPCTLSPALPGGIYPALKGVFSTGAKFWSETGYLSQQTRFSSFLYDLNQEPSNAVEAAICSLHQDLKQSHLGMAGILAAEWWAHMRDPTSAHQLHFDLDEGRIGAGAAKYRLVQPVLSTVLYLSDTGGPTLVLEQSAADELAQRAFLGTPSENTLFCFPGNYLHGVLPGQQVSRGAPAGGQRISLIIAWWGRDAPAAKTGAPGTGPCRVLPSSPAALRAQHRQSWLSDFEATEVGRSTEREVKWRFAASLAPAWMPVPSRLMWETPTRGGAPLEPEDGNGDGYFAVSKAPLQRGGVLPTRSLPLPALRFFLRSADEIRSVYVPQS